MRLRGKKDWRNISEHGLENVLSIAVSNNDRMRGKKDWRNISEHGLENVLSIAVSNNDRNACLDLGCGIHKPSEYVGVDIHNEFPDGENMIQADVDFVGDVRCLFAPDYREHLSDYPDLARLRPGSYMVVRAAHFVEHVEWIYMEVLFDWVFSLLAPGGLFYAVTPSLEYAVGVYLVNRRRQKKGKPVIYPIHEHDYLKEGVSYDMQRWVNFKLHSGCSPGDYHFTSYDAELLAGMYRYTGFENVCVYNGQYLKAIGYKPDDAGSDVAEAVRRATE